MILPVWKDWNQKAIFLIVMSQEKIVFDGKVFLFLCFSQVTFTTLDMQSYFELLEEHIAGVKNVSLELI